ncbi:MAG TPA: hypothetical protein VMI06_17635 [Terriglobia bacterium]|nr:hypothetical protein [Terriglobia bacterium]
MTHFHWESNRAAARPGADQVRARGWLPEGHSPSAQQAATAHVASKDFKANLGKPAKQARAFVSIVAPIRDRRIWLLVESAL